eukprot:TRINITY_DN1865_c0_g1_i1.p1 TRINITY_DN1865_c0_g1~~TRINITY_DN1865_c0_g1_i1.p1  ORF type:complete len:346 (+),score=51.87 TRINITY_DN1865_c0_g1_i1:94-1131(+)
MDRGPVPPKQSATTDIGIADDEIPGVGVTSLQPARQPPASKYVKANSAQPAPNRVPGYNQPQTNNFFRPGPVKRPPQHQHQQRHSHYNTLSASNAPPGSMSVGNNNPNINNSRKLYQNQRMPPHQHQHQHQHQHHQHQHQPQHHVPHHRQMSSNVPGQMIGLYPQAIPGAYLVPADMISDRSSAGYARVTSQVGPDSSSSGSTYYRQQQFAQTRPQQMASQPPPPQQQRQQQQQQQSESGCCLSHGDVQSRYSQVLTPSTAFRIVEVEEDLTVDADAFAITDGLVSLSNSQQRSSGYQMAEIPFKNLCMNHHESRCANGNHCPNVHLCREYGFIPSLIILSSLVF